MKNIFTALFIVIGVSFSAQVGIKTDTPKSTLDVNGDVNLRGKLVVLNPSDNNKLNEGTNGQILVSQGVGNPPAWKTLRIPEYEPNKFYLIFNNSFADKTGVKFTNSEESTITNRSTSFAKNVAFSSLNGFKKIPNLSQPITVYSTESKTYFQFETVVQANFAAVSGTDISIDYACGIFVDDKLVNLRQGNIKANNATSPFLTHNQIGIIENLAKGPHNISVACSRLKSYNLGNTTGIQLAVGINAASNIDYFIAQSSLKVDVYEVPQVFNTILN